MTINSVSLVGRAGADPEIKNFDSGASVTKFAIAVNRRKEEMPDWFNLEIWGNQAQIAFDYVKKGSLVGIVGRLNIESWPDRNTNETRFKTVVRVDKLHLLGSKRNSNNDSFSNNNNSGEIPFQALWLFINLKISFIKKYKKITIKIGFTKYFILSK